MLSRQQINLVHVQCVIWQINVVSEHTLNFRREILSYFDWRPITNVVQSTLYKNTILG